MICHIADLPVSRSENFKGGEGHVLMKDLSCGKKPANFKVCCEMVLEKGCSIGFHVHEGDSEIICILEGEGICTDGGADVPVRAGDAIVCREGEGHALRNECDRPLRYFAFVVAA